MVSSPIQDGTRPAQPGVVDRWGTGVTRSDRVDSWRDKPREDSWSAPRAPAPGTEAVGTWGTAPGRWSGEGRGRGRGFATPGATGTEGRGNPSWHGAGPASAPDGEDRPRLVHVVRRFLTALPFPCLGAARRWNGAAGSYEGEPGAEDRSGWRGAGRGAESIPPPPAGGPLMPQSGRGFNVGRGRGTDRWTGAIAPGRQASCCPRVLGARACRS